MGVVRVLQKEEEDEEEAEVEDEEVGSLNIPLAPDVMNLCDTYLLVSVRIYAGHSPSLRMHVVGCGTARLLGTQYLPANST